MIRLFRVFIPVSVLALLLSETALIASCYLAGALFAVEGDASIYLLYDGGLAQVGIVTGCILLGLYFHDLYSDFRVRFRVLLGQQVSMTVGMAFLLQALLAYASPEWMLPRGMMLIGSALALVGVPAWRILYSSVLLKAFGAERLLFVGCSPVLAETARRLQQQPELGMAVIGYVADEPDPDFPESRWLGEVGSLASIVAAERPSRIVVGLNEARQQLPLPALLQLRLEGHQIEEAGAIYEVAFGRVSIRSLRPSQLVFGTGYAPKPRELALQSLYSLLIAMAALALTAPLLVVIAVLVKLSSPGPVFYRQTRVGMGNRPFVLYKFRSMRENAEAATGAVWAIEDDPRVTPIGRFLRRFRLDELPQFFNVLRGEMSIVGPRPERPEFVKTLSEQIPHYRQRHCVRPGITGWAQINHHYTNSVEDSIIKLEYDLYYIKNLSMSLDLFIIFNTGKIMLLSRGAV